jgi:hypothetical protein
MKNIYRGSVFRYCLIVFSFLNLVEIQAQDEKELSPVSKTYAITNATIFQAPGRKVEKATVVLKDGLIYAVGKNTTVPPDAILIKGDSLFIYAGFIDGLSHAGVTKPKEDPMANREKPKDPGNPTPEAAGITPQNDVRSSLNHADKSIEELRALGFTVAQSMPYGNMLPGNSAIILLGGKSTDGMVLVSKSSLYSELTGAQRVYPNTILAVMAKWRELYRQSLQAKNYESLYASNRTGLNRPVPDRVLEAFYPVIDKKLPVLFEADKYLKIQRVLTLQNDLGFQVMLGDLKEGWDAIPKLRSANAKVFLSLDLPELKKEDDKKSTGDKTAEPKKESKPKVLTPEIEALEKRKAEFTALYTSQANAFQNAGVMFGFSTLSAKTTDIQANLRRMITAGLTEDQALAALTTSPAQLLGLSDRLGTIDNGKIANLVISDKPYFNEKAKVRYVFVDGVMYKYDSKETPKSETTKIDISGNWTVTIETPQEKTEYIVTFKKDGNNFSGSVSGGKLAQAINIELIELNGKDLKYSYTVPSGGQTYKVDVEAIVEMGTFKGTANMGTLGNFAVAGKKDPNR